MKTFDLNVSRKLKASAEEVFDAWVDPAKMSAWFGSARVIMNAVVDGLYYLAVEHQGRTWPHYGRYLKIERPRLIEQTWMSESTHGLESIVTIHIERSGDGVELTLRHTGLPDDNDGHQHQEGWTSLLDELEKKFKARA